MAVRGQTARLSHGGDEGGSWAPVFVIPILALIVNIGTYLLARSGHSFIVPINIVGGFTYRLAPLTPILEALILGFGLMWCARMGLGRAIGAVIALVVFRLAVAIAVAYGLAVQTASLSDAFLTSALAAYLPLVVATFFSGAALLFILALYEASFRSWWAWILALLIWAGGTALLFGLWRNEIVLASYPWLAQCVRALGFVVLGFQFRRSLLQRA